MKRFSGELETMKINELSKITNIHPETIRMYRNKGFLHPSKLENGYYDYSVADFASIVHLRKMREFSLSLDEISLQQHTTSQQEYLEVFDQRTKDLDFQIKELQERILYMQLEKNHIENVLSSSHENVQVTQSTDQKIDLYDELVIQEMFQEILPHSFYFNTTVSLYISKEILNGEIKDDVIPLQAGIGTYQFMLDHKHIPTPKNAVIIPNGKFITQMITLSDLTQINILSLAPMMQYAKDHDTPFISDTTAYLAFIHYENDIPFYTFRIRACIEKNDIKSKEALSLQ